MHSRHYELPDSTQMQKLDVFQGGLVLPVMGSISRTNDELINALLDYGLEVLPPLGIDTKDQTGINWSFMLSFRPLENKILVARRSHKDLGYYQAF